MLLYFILTALRDGYYAVMQKEKMKKDFIIIKTN